MKDMKKSRTPSSGFVLLSAISPPPDINKKRPTSPANAASPPPADIAMMGQTLAFFCGVEVAP